MKNNVANSDRILVDRPLNSRTAKAGSVPSLWTLSRETDNHVDAALRLFLMLCLIASLVLGGLKISGTPAAQESDPYKLTLRVRLSHPLPNASFGVSFR